MTFLENYPWADLASYLHHLAHLTKQMSDKNEFWQKGAVKRKQQTRSDCKENRSQRCTYRKPIISKY